MGSRPGRNSTRAGGGRSVEQSARRRPARVTSDDFSDDDPLLRLSRAISLVETIEAAMRTLEEEPEVGSICTCLELACKQLARAHGDVDLALQRVSKGSA